MHPIRLFLIGLALFSLSPVSHAQTQPEPKLPVLSLSAEGTAIARPDLAIVQVGVTSQAKTAKEAIAETSRLVAAVIAAAKEAGIEPRDLATSRVSLNPQYPPTRDQRRIVGYEAANALTIRVRELDKLGNLLDQLVVAGANDIRSISLTVSKPQPVLDEARAAAVKEALRKAQLYAEAGNLRVVRLVELVESGAVVPIQRVQRSYAAPSAAAAQARPDVPIEAGEQEFRVTMNAIFEIAPK